MQLSKLTQRILSTVFLAAVCSISAYAQRLVIVEWNLESGGSSDSVIAARVRTFQGIDIWGLSEVAGEATAVTFKTAAADGENAEFRHVIGTTGGADKLAVVYNATRFELVSRTELHRVTFNTSTAPAGSGQRSPLAVELRDRQSDKRFLFVVNHFARSDNALRVAQARRLNEWVREQTIPVIAVGDFNFDWDVVGGETNHDAGFDQMIANNAWTWARPATLLKTQCSPNFNSVLDFVFLNALAREWRATSTILQEAGDCDPSPEKPDHRPVKAEFDLTPGLPPQPPTAVPTRAELLQRVEELERQIQQLKELIQRLP